MRAFLRKTVNCLLIILMVAAPFAAYILISRYIFPRSGAFLLELSVLILLALAVYLLWLKSQSRIDRWLGGKHYGLLREIRDFNREVHDISNINKYGYTVVSLLSRSLQSSHLSLLLLTESKDYCAIATTRATYMSLAKDDPVIISLKNDRRILHKGEIEPAGSYETPIKQRKVIDGGALFCPLVTRGNDLEGLFVFGPKQYGRYSNDDEKLMAVTAKHVAVELENARLYASEKAMREELQQQDKHKTELLHSIAHELKTPLTAIISSSELLTDSMGERQIANEQNLIRNISRSAWWMNKRVTELADLAKIQVNRIVLDITAMDIGAVIEDIASRMRYIFKSKGQTLTLDLQKPLPEVDGDRERIEQILFNLLANANKYSSSNSVIMLHAAQNNSRVVIEIADAGPVIADKDRQRIFDPYYRGDDDIAIRRFPGLGLGLAICKHLVALHRGRMWVTPQPDKGNVFSFTIPVHLP